MSKTTIESVTCDCCKRELITHTAMPAKYCLQLSAIDTNRNPGGIQYAVHVTSPLEQSQHFCGFTCLKQWLDDKV